MIQLVGWALCLVYTFPAFSWLSTLYKYLRACWEHKTWHLHWFLVNRYQVDSVPCVMPDVQTVKCKFLDCRQKQRQKKGLFPIRLTPGEKNYRYLCWWRWQVLWNSRGVQVGLDTTSAFKKEFTRANTFESWHCDKGMWTSLHECVRNLEW